MKNSFLLLIFISFSTYSQTNLFTGTWSTEKRNNSDEIIRLTVQLSTMQFEL